MNKNEIEKIKDPPLEARITLLGKYFIVFQIKFTEITDSKKNNRNSNRKRFNHLAMPIIVNLDVMMAKRKMSLNELSEKVGLTLSNLSILKTGKAKAVRFSTLDAICKVLDCQPGDILEYQNEKSR